MRLPRTAPSQPSGPARAEHYRCGDGTTTSTGFWADWEDNGNELYHLPEDLGEDHDLAAMEAEQNRRDAQALKTRLEKPRAACLDLKWQPDPTWWKSLVPD